jgi:choline dehydrogenase-like flavoprotein
MMYELGDLERGFEAEADAVVVGSGAGGAVAAANLSRGGLRTIVLEAGPKIRESDMTRDAPKFLARYFWEGGVRLIGGSAQIPSMQGRCLGGSTVVNSAIMLRLPDWVRQEWAEQNGLDFLKGDVLDAAYERVLARTSTTPTPMNKQGRRNLKVRDALELVGIKSGPLPRAVKDCEGCGDCVTGCASGRKQSMDRCYLPDAEKDGAQIYTCAMAERILMENGRAAGVAGSVVDPRGRRRVASFVVRAPRVIVAAGAAQTPVLLLDSGLTGRGRVGATFFAHIGGGVAAIMQERMDPWIGATQGWGAMHPDIRGMKFESLFAPPSLIMVRWGDVGRPFLEQLADVKYATLLVHVYRAKVKGSVRSRRGSMPKMTLHIPDEEATVVMKGVKLASEALLKAGARHVLHGIRGVPEPIVRLEQAESFLTAGVKARDLPLTANHIFGSCPMSKGAAKGPVDEQGKLAGVEGVWVADASLFPSPSAVNPQATIMALADVLTRRIAELDR